MKLKRIDVYQVDLPYSGGEYLLSSGRSYSTFDCTIVTLHSDNGLVGWGESTPFGSNYIAAHAKGVRAAIDELAPQLIGVDFYTPDLMLEQMDKAVSGQSAAKCAIDVAAWDLFAKSLQMPVRQLLGGSFNDSLPLISSVHAGHPDGMRSRVDAFRAQGYRGHSIKIGASQSDGGPQYDADRIAACLSNKCADEFFIVDANGGLTVEHAIRMLNLLPAHLDFVLEAPCASLDETLRLRQKCNVPIYIDELVDSDIALFNIARHDIADGIGIKTSKNGGLTQARRQRDICSAAGLAMSVQDTVGSELAYATLLNFAHTVPEKLLRCVLDVTAMVTVSTGRIDVEQTESGVKLGNKIGLGFEPDMAVLGEPVASYC